MRQNDVMPLHEQLIEQMGGLKEDAVLNTVEQLLAEGEKPLTIIQSCQEGMRVVGKKYEKRQYYLAGLIMAGEILKQVIEMVEPALKQQAGRAEGGRVLLGTVEEDIHDLGKNIFKILLNCHGFTIRDLGVDVPAEHFLDEIGQFQPDIVGLSGVMLSSHERMKELRGEIERRFKQDRPALIIGGSQLDQEVADYIGVKHWTKDAMNGVLACQKILNLN